jgi:hypothetical protein
MAQTSLAMTFRDLLLRTAEYGGVASYGTGGDKAAGLPTDAHDLDLLQRIVNDGWARFIRAKPDWNWMAPTFSLTFDPTGASGQCVAQDPARYYLPDGFAGEFVTFFTYAANGPRRRIENVDEAYIRECQAQGVMTADPYFCAIRPLLTDNSPVDQRRWECVFWPTPGGVYTVTARLRLWPFRLTNLDDRPCAGFQFDRAILACALIEWDLQKWNKTVANPSHLADLEKAIQIDSRTAPKSLGYMREGSDGVRPAPLLSGNGTVDTYTQRDGTVIVI